MWATTRQIALMLAVPAGLIWVAMRRGRRRPGDPSSGDDTCNLVDFSSQDGSSAHQPAADFSGPSGDSASGGDGGSEGGGGGGSD